MASTDKPSPEQSSLRQSTSRPKRYDAFLDDDDAFATPGRLGNGSRSRDEGGAGEGAEDVPSDEEGDGLLRSTAHIWRAPLQQYILDLHAKRRHVEQDFEDAEASRKFVVAARAVDMAETRVVQMRERKAILSAEMQHEQQHRAREQEEQNVRQNFDDEKKTVKEREKEERLRKQRDAARRKREEEKAKKEHDNEQRRLRAEEARLAKIAEAERYAALSPEERDAEDRAKAEKMAREREENAARLKETEEELLTSGRGARKRQRRASSTLDGEDGTPSGIGRYAEYDGLDDDDDEDGVFEAPSSKSHKKKSRRPSASLEYATVPSGIFMAPDGSYCDAQGAPVQWPPPSASRQGSPFFGSDDGAETGAAGPGPKSHKKKPPLTPEELEKKVWMQIAKRDIPKVRPLSFVSVPFSTLADEPDIFHRPSRFSSKAPPLASSSPNVSRRSLLVRRSGRRRGRRVSRTFRFGGRGLCERCVPFFSTFTCRY